MNAIDACGHEKSPGGEARASDAVLTDKEFVEDSVTRVKDFIARVRTKLVAL
jgi:hypothetical protein